LREFQVFAKPAGAICNMSCHYCYYLEKEQLYPKGEPFHMPDDLLEEYIVQHIAASPGEVTSFSWHGGEPTILGIDYFRKIVALERKHAPTGRRIANGIQTNGILIDDDWCRFFAAEGFGVGLSLDGPQEMHDRYRVTRGQRSTHRLTMHAFKLLQRYRIPCDILCVVHNQNVQHPTRVYRFFKEIGAQYVGFLPVVEPKPGAETGVSSHTVPAEAYGTFLCTIFDEWIQHDVGRITVQIFEEASRPARGLDHSLCIFRERCGDIPVIEHNGDFYCCDHFVDEEHRLGNIRQSSLVDLLESPAQRAFGKAKQDALSRYCRQCEVLPQCNGGCPKDRFIRTPEGEPGLNYLCAGLKRFFVHSVPHLQTASAWSADQRRERSAKTDPFPQAGRNDPCPCGSGRKYKKCCLVK
jgi:uncharacterized protein